MTPTTPDRVPTGRPPRPGTHEPSFQEIVAEELARAPWFMLSIALHVLVFLLLHWLIAARTQAPERPVGATLLLAEKAEAIDFEETAEEKVEVEQQEGETLEEPQLEARFDVEQRQVEPTFETDVLHAGLDGVGLLTVRGKKGGSDADGIFALGSDALRKGALRQTVAGLRGTGFEVVFVFDSTGSMDDVLAGAKRRIFRMVEVLHALVPGARIGIVTYRDRGRSEDYVTRSVGVTTDVYRVMNFMHTIEAGGGGDFPEAVLDALKVATKQRWLPGSRRVVVLIGDAPPHAEEEKAVKQTVTDFARGQAFVHTIATVDGARSREPNADTKRTFEAIARDGRGQYAQLEDEDAVLQEVLSLAFGSQHRRDLDEVYALVDKQTKRTEVSAFDMVQRGDLAAVERALRRQPVDDEVVKAAIKLPSPAVTRFMVEKLGDPGFPQHGRHACAYAVMQILGMRLPPLDPESDDPLPQREVQGLLRRLNR